MKSITPIFEFGRLEVYLIHFKSKKIPNFNIEFVVHTKGVKLQDGERSIEISATKYGSAMASVNADNAHTYRIVDDEA